MKIFAAVILICLCSRVTQQECAGDTSCLVSDQIEIDGLNFAPITTEANETEITTTESFTTEETETTTTVKSTTSTTTLSPTTVGTPPLKPLQPSAICWCDEKEDACDMNCCCDIECSLSQKQVFTHCSDQAPIYDARHCYSSNIFFKKPSDYKSTQSQGLFCVVRDNLSTKKEFETRPPITSVEEFERTIGKTDRSGQVHRTTWVPKFSYQAYKAGNLVWAINKGNLTPFSAISKTFGNLCLTTLPVTYLENLEAECVWKIPRKEPMCSQAVNSFLSKLRNPILISPLLVNISDVKSSLENCSGSETCVPMRTFLCKPPNKCSKIDKLQLKPTDCTILGLDVAIHFYHNGTEGILSASAFIQLLNTTVLKTSVKFLWSDSEHDGFLRSGNPGYITGRPILAGRKISSTVNETSEKREAIQLTVNPKGWLTMFGNDKGKCSSQRQSIAFGVNQRQSCFLQLKPKYLSKNGCVELQSTVFEYLLHDTRANLTNFNKYLGVYGNARVETISDWLQIVVDYFPLISTHPTFSNYSHGLTCRGIFTHIYLDIAKAKFGSFYSPQLKIVGALVRFAPPEDYYFRCKSSTCEEIAKASSIKLMTEVNFVDVSKPAERKFAQPPGLEAKLPHDFFYPFFTHNQSVCHFISPIFIIASLSLSL